MEKHKRSIFYKLIWCAMIIIQILVIIFWGNVKEGFFIDELYSMEGAHSITGLSLSDNGYKWQDQEGFFESWHDSEEFVEHVTVVSEDSLLDQQALTIVNKIVKRPFYALLNIVSCMNAGVFSKWHGIGLNIVIFIIEQILLYCLTFKITKSEKDSVVVTAFYGFSAGAISTVIFIRTYMLSTLYVILITYMHYFLWHNNKWWKEFVEVTMILIVTYLGYKVHPYVLIYSVSLFMVYVVGTILRKLWKKCIVYFGMFATAAAGYLATQGIESLVSSEQGGTAVENLLHKPIVDFIKDVVSYVMTIVGHLLGNKYWLLLCVGIIGCILCYLVVKKREQFELVKKNLLETIVSNEVLVALGLVVVIYIVAIGRICPWVSWRYISNIYPILALVGVGIAKNYLLKIYTSKKTVWILGGFMAVCLVLSYNVKSIRELHLGAKEEKRILSEEYSDVDSIFVYDGDEGRLYLNSYIYAPDTEVYITEKNEFSETDIFTGNSPEKLLVWVSAVNVDFENTLDYFMNNSSYNKADLLLDRSRHNECYYVYLVQK